MERRYMNSFNLVGQIISPPERFESSSGTKICRLRLSVDKTGREQAESSEVYEVALFRNLAGEEYRVGQYVAVSGKLQANNYEKDGNQYFNVRLLGSAITVLAS